MCWRRSFVRSLSPSVVISVPATSTVPEVGLSRPGENVHQRRLPRARRAHHGGQARALDVDRNAPEGVDGRLALPVAASHVRRDDDRPVSVPVHATQLLSSNEGLRLQPPLRPWPKCRRMRAKSGYGLRRRDPSRPRTGPSGTDALLAPVRTKGWPSTCRRSSRRSCGSSRTSRTSRSSGCSGPLRSRAGRSTRTTRSRRRSGEARNGRSQLPPLRPEAARAYATDVRERVLEALEHTRARRPGPAAPKGHSSSAWCSSTSCSTRRRCCRRSSSEPRSSTRCGTRARHGDVSDGPDEIRVGGGSFILGATDEPWAYDNELVAHEVELGAFFIDRTPVTNARFRGLHLPPRLQLAEALEPGGLGVARDARTRRRRSSGSAARTAGSGFASAGASRSRPTSPCSTSPGTRPTRTPAGPESDSPPKRSGSGRRPGTSAAARTASRGVASGRATRRISAIAASPPLPRARTSAARARSAAAS